MLSAGGFTAPATQLLSPPVKTTIRFTIGQTKERCGTTAQIEKEKAVDCISSCASYSWAVQTSRPRLLHNSLDCTVAWRSKKKGENIFLNVSTLQISHRWPFIYFFLLTQLQSCHTVKLHSLKGSTTGKTNAACWNCLSWRVINCFSIRITLMRCFCSLQTVDIQIVRGGGGHMGGWKIDFLSSQNKTFEINHRWIKGGVFVTTMCFVVSGAHTMQCLLLI